MKQAAGVEAKRLTFDNGDQYIGALDAHGLPDGQGTYIWHDKSCYEGQWKAGAKHGFGKYTWPSGAVYEGDWYEGSMWGLGTFEMPDGTVYQGGWAKDMKNGLGKKTYANGDVYEGLWKNGKMEGPGRYRWHDDNEYDGEWRAGKMHGQGTFAWKTGERYDGEWQDGHENGLGVFTFRDGATYDGFWKAGVKHGIGVYRPASLTASAAAPAAAADRPAGMNRLSSSGGGSVQLSNGVVAGDSPASDTDAEGGGAADDESPFVSIPGVSAKSMPAALQPPQSGRQTSDSAPGTPRSPSLHKKAEPVVVKEYKEGILVRHSALDPVLIAAVFGKKEPEKLRRRATMKAAALQGKHVVKLGQVVYKDNSSYDLMLNLQLGIRWSVAHVQQEPDIADLTQSHFASKYVQVFPHDGSTDTPVHPSYDFIWKDYAPMMFRKLREVSNVLASDYIQQLCSDQSLRLLNSPGKSGAVFFLSADDKFLVKTIRTAEYELLRQLLPKYYAHMARYSDSLLVKFYGLHSICSPSAGGRKVRFIVMGNMFRTELQIHRRYDLKGSTAGRTVGEHVDKDDASVTLKDLDLDYTFKLEQGWHERLMRQVQADCAFLESCHIMDYSMLLGVHFRGREGAQSAGEGLANNFSEFSGEQELSSVLADISSRISSLDLHPQQKQDLLELARLNMLEAHGKSKRAKLARSPTLVLARRPKRSATLRPVPFSEGANDELALTMGQSRVQLGMNMAATAIPKSGSGPPEDVVLYFGVIDILTAYDFNKSMESLLKSFTGRHASISAVNPRFYSKRFQKFMSWVFC
eukprot:jgi/Chrzof1/5257/Cz15g19070.t1